MTTREEKAVRFFTSGDNCAQSVLKAYCDLVGLTEEQAALVSVAFGGGIGRMRGNCGAFSAAIMVCGALDDGDIPGRAAFCVLSVLLLAALCSQTADCSLNHLQEWARMYSAEIEYSDENMEALLDALRT